ncbi:MAG TPA: CpaF family protein [Candidatus Dormibacteraeota bacterium]
MKIEKRPPFRRKPTEVSSSVPETATPAPPANPPATFLELKASIFKLLLQRDVAEVINVGDREQVRAVIVSLTDSYLAAHSLTISAADHDTLVASLVGDVLGFGPLEPLFSDPDVTEIMVNNAHQIFVERHGRVTLSPITFESDEQLMSVIQRAIGSVGRRVDESSPMVDARLEDGSRVNVVLRPLVLKGPAVTIRRFSQKRLTADDLVAFGTASPAMMAYLRAAVRSRASIIVSGGTSSGKTTLLNVLSRFIPEGERIITIEDAAELQLEHEDLITMQSRLPNVEGTGAVTIRDLVRNALRMRPDRIVVGECRGGEALDMLQAMNTGHEGSLSTIHANSPEDALSRLETMAMMAGSELPAKAIVRQIAAAVDIIVQTERLRGGKRRIVRIAEITGLHESEVQIRDLFAFNQTGVSADGDAIGAYTATGQTSRFLERFRVSGEELPESIFEPAAESELSS